MENTLTSTGAVGQIPSKYPFGFCESTFKGYKKVLFHSYERGTYSQLEVPRRKESVIGVKKCFLHMRDLFENGGRTISCVEISF